MIKIEDLSVSGKVKLSLSNPVTFQDDIIQIIEESKQRQDIILDFAVVSSEGNLVDLRSWELVEASPLMIEVQLEFEDLFDVSQES